MFFAPSNSRHNGLIRSELRPCQRFTLILLVFVSIQLYILLIHMRLFFGCLSDRYRYNDLTFTVNLTASLYASLSPVVLTFGGRQVSNICLGQ
jgi:hypothetical protein